MYSQSKEDLLLLSCARTDANMSRIKEILSSPLNWDYIIVNAQRHGISPLLYYNLSSVENDTLVPDKAMKTLRGRYYATLARNMRLYDELHKVLESYRDAGINVIVLKGAALAENVYQDIGLRSFEDIDILVREDDLQKAKKVILAEGYTLNESISPEAFSEKYGCDLHYVKDIIIEIHWDIVRRKIYNLYTEIKIDELWGNAQPAKIANTDALVLAPEDMLLHLCVHLSKHGYNRLIWLCDLSGVIGHYDINWEHVLKNASNYKVKAYMYYGLQFASRLLGADVPGHILQELKPNNLQTKLFYSIHKNVLFPNKRNILYKPLLKLLLIDRTRDQLRFLGEYVFRICLANFNRSMSK